TSITVILPPRVGAGRVAVARTSASRRVTVAATGSGAARPRNPGRCWCVAEDMRLIGMIVSAALGIAVIAEGAYIVRTRNQLATLSERLENLDNGSDLPRRGAFAAASRPGLEGEAE